MKPLFLKFWNEPQPVIALLSAAVLAGQQAVGLPGWAHAALGVLGVVAAGASARVG